MEPTHNVFFETLTKTVPSKWSATAFVAHSSIMHVGANGAHHFLQVLEGPPFQNVTLSMLSLKYPFWNFIGDTFSSVPQCSMQEFLHSLVCLRGFCKGGGEVVVLLNLCEKSIPSFLVSLWFAMSHHQKSLIAKQWDDMVFKNADQVSRTQKATSSMPAWP